MKALRLEDQFHYLDALPELLFERVVNLAHGRLQERVAGILFWRESLLRGVLPAIENVAWPESTIAEIILQRLDAVGLPPLCRDEESLVDQVLRDICTTIESILQWQEQDVDGLFDDLLSSQSPVQESSQGDPRDTAIEQAAGLAFHDVNDIAESLEKQWITLLAHWKETHDAFSSMGVRLGRGWDLSRGILATEGWRDFVAYRKLMRAYPRLKEIIDTFGREQEKTARVKKSRTAVNGQPLETQAPVKSEVPLSTQGVTQSDDIARMLPQEAAFLGHPKLHMLWHARRAEHALLSYQVEGVLSGHQANMQILGRERMHAALSEVHQKGPIILCIDTSGSMHGQPEQLAKAICLEVIRRAASLRQPCLLFAFSGPGQILEQTLSFNQAGLTSIIRFLQQTFHGGTDIREPFARALRRISESRWQCADIVLVSDGRFPVPEHLLPTLAEVREKEGLRIFGLLVGQWSASAMGAVCQTVYRVDTPVSAKTRD